VLSEIYLMGHWVILGGMRYNINRLLFDNYPHQSHLMLKFDGVYTIL
jgi:hypothetical protein